MSSERDEPAALDSDTECELVFTEASARLDSAFARDSGYGRRKVRQLLGTRAVLIDGRIARASQAVRAGQRLRWSEPAAPAPTDASSPHSRCKILWKDPTRAAIAKPALVHTHAGRRPPCVADHLKDELGDLTDIGDRPEEWGIAHRLDRDTSGVLLLARTRSAFVELRRAFQDHQIKKTYLALVSKRFEAPQEIEVALARRGARVAAATRYDRALAAHTQIRPLEIGTTWSLVEATTNTGAPHQIRVHLALLGHPILGDPTYGRAAAPPGTRNGQLLHAMTVEGPDALTATAAIPEDFALAYETLLREDGSRAESP